MKALIGFAGFGGPEVALREVGIEATGIEIDHAIAEVNRYNGGHCLAADLLDIDPADYIGWLLFHFSPPCPRFSAARNSKAIQPFLAQVLDLARHQRVVNGETEEDIRLARKICEFIRVGQPKFFTLENVWGYRKSLSWHLIQYTLLEEGYGLDAWNLNTTDYGVPQSRRRMIVIARRDGRQPAKPWQTHARQPDMFTKPWRGWYEAIEDLIPRLPESQFAPWQMDRLPEELKTFLINNNSCGDGTLSTRPADRPAFTVVSTIGEKGAMPRAFLVPGDTFIMNSANRNSNNGCGTTRNKDAPVFTVTSMKKHGSLKAFILGQGGRSSLKDGEQPADTVTANNNQTGVKALIVGGQYQTPNTGGKRIVQNTGGDRPVWTITASDKLDTRAYVGGKVVSMTPRCLARFQDFPDWFVLPDNRELACRGIGNALPPSLYRAVLRSLDL
jgi:site-specific DNA-cytosine methylase